MRTHALIVHPELEGKLVEGSLPGGLPDSIAGRYDGILLSAVLMHIPDADLFEAAFEIRHLLVENGKLLVSIATERGDVAPKQNRDRLGRLMILRSPSQVKLLFERLGFTLESEWSSADAAGRADIQWATLLFRYSGVSPRPLDRIESILNIDRKVATYKLALLRALCDIALTAYSSVRWEAGGRVTGPNPSRGLAVRPEAVRDLAAYRASLAELFAMGLRFEPVTREDVLSGAVDLQRRYGLLTSDSIIAGCAQRLGVDCLITLDRNCAAITELNLVILDDFQAAGTK